MKNNQITCHKIYKIKRYTAKMPAVYLFILGVVISEVSERHDGQERF